MTVREYVYNSAKESFRIRYKGTNYLVSKKEAYQHFGSKEIIRITNNIGIELLTVQAKEQG